MTIADNTSLGVQSNRGHAIPRRTEFTLCTTPQVHKSQVTEDSNIGVSTSSAQPSVTSKVVKEARDVSHWYALRATYGREMRAYEYLLSKGVTAFCPTINVVKEIKGKRRTITETRLPNIFFAYGTEEQIKTYVYDNINLPFLRFYYRHIHVNNKIEKIPLVVPNAQIESLKIICDAEENDIIISASSISKFETGQLVRVIDGSFRGVIGRVARYQGQQRVAVVVNDLFTACTAYIPKAFIELI